MASCCTGEPQTLRQVGVTWDLPSVEVAGGMRQSGVCEVPVGSGDAGQQTRALYPTLSVLIIRIMCHF